MSYPKKLLKKFLIWLSNTELFSTILLKIIPFLRLSVYYTPTRGNQYNAAYNVIQKGDFILARDGKKLTTLLIGGEWTHAVQFMGKLADGADYECAEMTHHNYTKSDLFDVCKESSDFAVFRINGMTPEYADQMIEKTKTFADAKYDQKFELGVRALYCSELIFLSDFLKLGNFDLSDIANLGMPYISPSGLALGNVTKVFDSRDLAPRY